MAYIPKKIIDDVWAKGSIVSNNDSNIWRKDFAGAWIRKDMFGTKGKYGWEIDHLQPLSKGGSRVPSNMVPIHWENNRSKGNDFPDFKTSVTSESNTNIAKVQSWKINLKK